MALKKVVDGNANRTFIRVNDLEIGQSVAGYLLGTVAGKYKGSFLIKMLTKDNQVITVTSNGTLANLEDQIAKGEVNLGLYTEFTKIRTYESSKQTDKDGNPYEVGVFDVNQDDEDTISDEDAAQAMSDDQARQTAASQASAARTTAGARPGTSSSTARSNVRR